MPLKILKFLILIAIIGTIIYVFHYNRAEVQVFYKSGQSLTASMGLVLLSSFIAGATFCFLFALIVGLRLQLRNWKTNKQKKQIEDHQSLIDEARGQLALGNCERARALFQKVVSKDPSDIGARAFLAKTFHREGRTKDALNVLDEARAEDKKNTELLLLASDLNAELGNHTAAYDNAAMVLKLVPKNQYALEKLVRDCIPLQRFDEAVEYQRQLIKYAQPADVEMRQNQLAELELKRVRSEFGENPEEFKSELKSLLKRHRGFAPALNALAKIESEEGNKKEANNLWKKAFAESGAVTYLAQLATMWIAAGEQDSSVSNVTSALSDYNGSSEKLALAKLFLVKLLLHLGHTDEAKSVFSGVLESGIENPVIERNKTLIKARFFEKEGKLDSAFNELAALFEIEPLRGLDEMNLNGFSNGYLSNASHGERVSLN